MNIGSASIASLLALLSACSTMERPSTVESPAVLDSVVVSEVLQSAAVTGETGELVAWGYRFAPGDRFRMRRRTVMTNTTGSPLFFEGTDEVLVEIDSVHDNGTITITMTTLRNVMREEAGPEHPLVKSSYSDRTPKIRATIDRLGHVINGDVLEDTPDRIEMKRLAALPNPKAGVISDLRLVTIETDDFLPVLFGPSVMAVGKIYRDTTEDIRTAVVFRIDSVDSGKPVPGGTIEQRLGDRSSMQYTIRTIRSLRLLGWVMRDGRRYMRAVEESDRVHSDGQWLKKVEYVFSEDGTIVSATTSGTTLRRGAPEGTFEERLELLRE